MFDMNDLESDTDPDEVLAGSASRPTDVLILQGPLSSFYADIAKALREAGAKCAKIQICGNDRADWHGEQGLDYSGQLADFERFLDSAFPGRSFSHVLMHSDRRPYHRAAISWARRNGVDPVVTELGYLRPDWMTLERGAVSTGSHFPTDATTIRDIARNAGPIDARVLYPDRPMKRILQELRYTAFNLLHWWRYPHYETHRPDGPLKVYPGFLKTQLTKSSARRRGASALELLKSKNAPYFVFALQLNGDFQLRDHSPFNSMAQAIDFVAKSFSANAPEETVLVLKPHPLDFRQKMLRAAISKAERDYGLAGRILMVEDIPIKALCEQASGFVTVNSSAGMEALSVGTPAMTIMPTIYDVEGLTFRGPLDAFWTTADKPDPSLYDALCRAMAVTIQVRGTIYNDEGRIVAAKAIADRLVRREVNEPGGYVDRPPRLEKAASMGVFYPELESVDDQRVVGQNDKFFKGDSRGGL
ncbi:MAG: capsular biosynthesis protein [Pseudomonadota bacterium]